MGKYVIDTNVIYGVIFDNRRCNVNHVLDVLTKNTGIVTYATLFEAFNKYKNEKPYIGDIMKFLNYYKMDIACFNISENADKLFYKLVYKEKELSDTEIEDLRRILIIQVCKYVTGFLGQLMSAFAKIYTHLKLNKEDDAYNLYILYSTYITDNFSHFPILIKEFCEKTFIYSYVNESSEKFSSILQKEFWGIISSVEVHYRVLAGKSPEYIQENDFTYELEKTYEEFDKQYNEKDYLKFIKQTYKDISSGTKMVISNNDLLSVIDPQLLNPLEKDFYFYCLNRIFLNHGKFKFNDIIDFINLSTALHYANGIMTLDNPFLKIISEYNCIKDSVFYETLMLYNKT